MTYISEKSKMPTGEHWAIITFDSIWIPGDERSRTHPGHGYPEHSESVVKYQAFTDKAEWEKEIMNLMNPRFGSPKDNWIAIKANPAKIKTIHTVEID